MKNIAFVKDNVVDNIIVVEDGATKQFLDGVKSDFGHDSYFDASTVDGIGVGWVKQGNTFVAPPPPEEDATEARLRELRGKSAGRSAAENREIVDLLVDRLGI